MTDKTRKYNAITNKISITVFPQYLSAESNPAIGKFIYSYHITIENQGFHTVKLLTRHWSIIDSIQVRREVNGEGVVGQQPEIDPGQSFSYMSFCPLNSPIGKMKGDYNFRNLDDNSTFDAEIPEFLLISDFKLN